MSHLHVPDGLLPVPLWVAGLVVALLLLARASYVSRAQSPQRIAYQGALGGLMLALMGHGGLTVIGLNALILGAGAATAALAYRPLATRLSPAWALAGGAALGQVVTGALWLAVVGLGMRLAAAPVPHA